jgi:hypothetical protein
MVGSTTQTPTHLGSDLEDLPLPGAAGNGFDGPKNGPFGVRFPGQDLELERGSHATPSVIDDRFAL